MKTRDRRASQIFPQPDGTALVELTQGKFARIDQGDIPLVRAFKWFAKPSRPGVFYAVYTPKGCTAGKPMHRLLLGLGEWNGTISVDHINGDGLDNRRCNLRAATHTIQKLNERRRSDNTSGVAGVHLRPNGTWQARVAVGSRRYSLGHFPDFNNAVRVQSAVRELIADLLDETKRAELAP